MELAANVACDHPIIPIQCFHRDGSKEEGGWRDDKVREFPPVCRPWRGEKIFAVGQGDFEKGK